MKKKLLALLLALAMLVGMLPASVFASSTAAAAADSDGTAAADDDSDDSSEEKDYIGDSSYYYEQVSFTDDDVSDYDADNSSDYSWSASATSDYYTMSGYYYAVTDSSTNETTYYQVYYKVTTSTSTDDDGNTTTAIASVTLYYTMDGTNYSTIGTVSESTGITLYKAYIDSVLDYDALYAAINGTLAESSSSDITDLTILRGYYYVNNGTLYYVYYLYTAPTTDSEGNVTTAATITLYYSSSASATSTSDCTLLATLTSGGSTTVTLYTEFELNISAYENTAQVFWDLDDSSGEYNSYDGDDGSSSYITSVTMTNTNTDEAQTVTFGESTDTTDYSAGTSSDSSYEWETPTGGLTLSSVYVDSDGTAVSDAAYASEESTLSITPAEGYYVSQVIIVCAPYAGKSTDSDDDDDDDDDGDNNGDNGETPDIPGGGGDGGETGPDGGGDTGGGGTGGEGGGSTGGGTFSLAAASDESEAVTADETATDSETEAAAASEDDLVTAAENTGRLSPYQCSTYVTGQAYEGTFTLSDSTASSSGYTLTINLSNEYFAHSGALATEETQVYFILIKVASVPTPAYVEYDYGDIVSYISAYNTANELTGDDALSSSIFTSNADGWTDTYTVSTTDDDGNTTTSDGNVYTDNSSNTYSGTITGTGGVLTDDTQYEYVYDTDGSVKTSNWKHYANSITEDAVKAAAAAGYVFAGWAVTWYADASVASDSSGNATKTTSNYNYYTITFSDALYTSLRTEGAEVQVVGHVRLVAQWVKADDITQVIDYGLPVSTDVAEENEDDLALKAITSNVSSRTSSSTDYSSAKTTTLSTKITDVQYKVTTTTTTTDDDGNETTSTTTGYQTTASGTYGDFSLDSTDSGTAIYTLDTQMTGIESVEYQVTLSYVTGSGSTATTTALCYPTGTISIVPATSMYYEESFGKTTTTSTDEDGEETTTTTYGLVTYTDGKSSGWSEKTTEGVDAATYQEAGVVDSDTEYSTYGSDTYYLSNLKDSNGSTMYVDTTNGAASFSYEFTGTGTAIYSEISTSSAYIRVVVTGTDADGKTTSVDTEYIDTRVVKYVGDTDTVLYNIPVYELTDLDYGTYTVTVTVAKAKTTVSATYQIETDSDGNKLYYQVDSNGDLLYYESENSTDTTTEETDYPVTGTTKTDYPVYATDEDGNYVVLANGESGKDFYLDGIRIYGPVQTSVSVNDDYSTVQDVYEADSEANATALNVYDYLYSVSDALESGNEGFVTITDTNTGTITDYDDYFAVGPNNEVYLYKSSSSTDEETGETTTTTTYSLSFYLLNYDTSTYDIYIGMKSPYGTTATVTLGSSTTTSLTLNNSADCYYNVETYLEKTDISDLNLTDEDGDEITTAYKLTITGSSGLAAITWIKVTSTKDEYEIAFDVNVSTEDEGTGDTEDETLTLAADTLYMVSEAAVAALAASDDDEVTDEDMLDDDSMGVDPEDDTDADSESDDTEEEEDEDAVFEPETFSASITYLKLLRYASITVKTSSDVSYITVNGTKVTGRSFGSSGTKTFSYTASRVSSGTTFEIIAYDSDGTASEPVTLTAK